MEKPLSIEERLYDYQNDGLERLREGIRQGHRSQLLYAPTGAGKTEIAIALLNSSRSRSRRSAMILDRIVLCNQTSSRLDSYGIDHGVLQAGHWRWRPYEHIQVCSAQTLEKRKSFPGLELLIVDECFVAGTKISTPRGLIDIDLLRCGDSVYNQNGFGIVEAISIKNGTDLYRLEFDDGSFTECTGSHPYFTECGWKFAKELEVGSYFFSIEGMLLLWERVETLGEIWGGGQDHFGARRAELEQANRLLSILLKEIEKPHEQSSEQNKNDSQIAGDQAQAYQAWRKRAIAALATIGTSSCVRRGMGIGIFSSNENGASQRQLSQLLQNGFSKSIAYDWHRNRWQLSHNAGEESAGQKENRLTCFPRLVNISPIKREGIIPVFNLQVSGHPSYFADGKLVHNCHQTRQATKQFIDNHPHIKVIGLTATPFTKGLGGTYSNVINTVTTEFLVNKGVLAPLRVFLAKEIDMTGAKKIAGEWSDAEATSRGIKITGDVVSEWIKKTNEIFGGPRKTIVFCASVAHGADLAEKFNAAGYNFIPVSYKDSDEFKKEVFEDFAKADTGINGLIAVDVLTKGFDVPDVMIGVSARPFSKSLSSHIQQMGRVMRGYPNKQFALWLDFSGNYLRFRDDWDDIYTNGCSELDDGREKPKPEPSTRDKEAAKCPRCSHLWGKSDICSCCGFVRQRRSMVEATPGELEEIDGKKVPKVDKQAFYSQLLFLVNARGYKEGWAAWKYKERFGVFPRGMTDIMFPPTAETLGWLKSRQIAYYKGTQKWNSLISPKATVLSSGS